MGSLEQLKQKLSRTVDELDSFLWDISLKIHEHPEVGYSEEYASSLLTECLEKVGFQVEKGIAGLPTAFRARTGYGRPKIIFMAEYDALPEIGHACGHNLIAAMCLGAATALARHNGRFQGTVEVLGCPAEEGGGGKIKLLQAGAFAGADIAMSIHPGPYTTQDPFFLAVRRFKVTYKGKSAHAAAAPEKGIDALKAAMLTFANIDASRIHHRRDARVHGIITKGGTAVNIITETAEAEFMIRALDEAYLAELVSSFEDCVKAAELATKARAVIESFGIDYAPNVRIPALMDAYTQNMARLGVEVQPWDPLQIAGSSDVGNVSQVVPTMHPFLSIADKDISLHHQDFAAAARSEKARTAMLNGAKTMAWIAAEALLDQTFLEEVKRQFRERTKKTDTMES